MKRILVAGDSHSMFWSGYNDLNHPKSIYNGIDCLHIGPATAYNLSNKKSHTQAQLTIESHIAKFRSRYECVMFSFGEIDCRVHVVRNAIISNKSIDDVVTNITLRYIRFVREFSNKYNMKCLIWGPIPSSPPSHLNFNADFPTVGSILERNYATYLFNKNLSNDTMDEENIQHLSVFDHLVNKDYITKGEYLYDGCHLSNLMLDVAETALREALRKMNLIQDLAPALERRWQISPAPKLRNVAAGAHYVASSRYSFDPKVFADGPDSELKFCTNIEDNPFIIITFDSAYLVKKIRLHNREEGDQERSRTVAVALSEDGKNFVDVFAPMEPVDFQLREDCLEIDVDTTTLTRFVKIYLRERNYFHLQCVEVLANSYAFDA